MGSSGGEEGGMGKSSERVYCRTVGGHDRVWIWAAAVVKRVE